MFFLNKKIEPIVWKRGEKTPVNGFLQLLSGCGITEELLFERRKRANSLNDAFWSICNEYLLKHKQANNRQCIKHLYLQMEYLLVGENKNANYVVKQRLYNELLDQKEQGASFVIIVSGDQSCAECKKLDGQEMKIDEAIKKQVLPPETCTCQRCTCIY